VSKKEKELQKMGLRERKGRIECWFRFTHECDEHSFIELPNGWILPRYFVIKG